MSENQRTRLYIAASDLLRGLGEKAISEDDLLNRIEALRYEAKSASEALRHGEPSLAYTAPANKW